MGKVINGLNTGLKHVLNVLLLTMVIVVFMQVLFRFALDQPLAWTEELARYLLVWITFLGASFAMAKKAHIGVDIIVDKLPPVLKNVIAIIASLISLSFFIMIIKESFTLIERTMVQTSPVLGISMGYIYTVIPVACFIMAINLIYITIEEFKKQR